MRMPRVRFKVWLLMALVAAVALALGYLRRPFPIATAAYPADADSPTTRWVSPPALVRRPGPGH
jgi:hypothetical protein